MIQKSNPGARVAVQTLGQERDLSVFYSSIPDLANQLRETDRMARIRDSVWRQREWFTFDAHVDELVAFFRAVIASAPKRHGTVAGAGAVNNGAARLDSPQGAAGTRQPETVSLG